MKNATESCSTLGAYHGQWTLVQKSDQVFTDGTFIPSSTPIIINKSHFLGARDICKR